MSITLSAPPSVIQDVRAYATRNGTSLNALIRAYLEQIAEQEQKARKAESEKVLQFFMGQNDWFDGSVKFDRDEANRR